MPTTAPEIHVAAGALRDSNGRVLIAKRPDGVHQGGLWEFPGGKLEPGETVLAGLARELHEEIGIHVEQAEPLIQVRHDYGDRRILLDVFNVTRFRGEPVGCEGQPLRWCEPHALDPDWLPAADGPIINALRLPRLCLITHDAVTEPGDLLQQLQWSLAGRPRLVQFRAPRLSDRDYRALVPEIHARCIQAGARLVLNRDPAVVSDLPADGLHLSARWLRTLASRPGNANGLVGASCHDAEELEMAVKLGLDYAFLSPVLPTRTHPNVAPLGWSGFRQLVADARIPVYGLGGLGLDDLSDAIQAGGQGIAAIRGLWVAA